MMAVIFPFPVKTAFAGAVDPDILAQTVKVPPLFYPRTRSKTGSRTKSGGPRVVDTFIYTGLKCKLGRFGWVHMKSK